VFGKGKKKQPEEGAAAVPERGLTLMKLNLPPIFLVVLVVLVCGYVAYLQYAGLVKKAQQVQHVAEAERMAALLGGRLVALGDSVAVQARADKALAVAIEQGDTGAIRLFEQGLKSYFPEAVRIRVIRTVDTDPDMSVRPPIGYACLDLARQAETGTDRPPLEMHLHGSEFAHLDLVRPIMHEGKMIASLMVSFEPENIKGWLKKLIIDSGYVELQQGWEGPVLGRMGDTSVKHDKPTHRAVIPASSWQLSYWASGGIGMAEAQKATFLGTFGVTALVIAILMYFYARFISLTIKRELHGMAEFMLQSSRGKRFHSYPVKMLEMEQTLQVMEPVLRQVKSDDDIKEKAEQGDHGVPDMMFMDFGEITVEEGEGDAPSEGDNGKS
jgi:phosphomannomutase/phosphoglucomutase